MRERDYENLNVIRGKKIMDKNPPKKKYINDVTH